MKIKLQIKNRFKGSLIFEFEKENNTIKDTVIEAVKSGAYLRGAFLRTEEKIKTAAVFTGLYQYIVITESNENRIKLGCYNRSLVEWEADFWNNNNEFPNNNSLKSNLRLMAFNTAKEWLKLNENL